MAGQSQVRAAKMARDSKKPVHAVIRESHVLITFYSTAVAERHLEDDPRSPPLCDWAHIKKRQAHNAYERRPRIVDR